MSNWLDGPGYDAWKLAAPHWSDGMSKEELDELDRQQDEGDQEEEKHTFTGDDIPF